jgi:two-component system, OmpR family, sensor histidine kinase SenX3
MATWSRRRSRTDTTSWSGTSATAEAVALSGSDRLTASLDALPVGVVVVDGDGREIVRNRAAHFDGVRHHQVLLDEALEQLLADVRLDGGSGERTIRLQGQQQRVVTLSAHPLAAGGVIATIADITERVRLDNVRTDFVANLSHELKTPVGAIAVLAETVADLLGGSDLTDEDRVVARRLADKMVAESHRMSHSINELLELSRIELEGAVVRTDVAVASVVRDAVERVRPLAEPAGIVVTVAAPCAEVTVRGDARQLTSALGNLLENAVKYSDPGGGVEIGARTIDDAIEFWVRDHGVGIPARDLDRIFERFYRVDRARSRDTGGTGLGLAIVRHVATNHDGTVSVTSVEGEGSTFVLRVPKSFVGLEEDQ